MQGGVQGKPEARQPGGVGRSEQHGLVPGRAEAAGAGAQDIPRLDPREVGQDRRGGAQQVQERLHEEIQGAGRGHQGQEGSYGCSGQEVNKYICDRNSMCPLH